MMDSISDHLKTKDYNGFKFMIVLRSYDSNSYQFRFDNYKENKCFVLSLTHQSILHMTGPQILDYIDKALTNHPDLRKAAHHQEFYKKFDEILK